MSWLRRCATVAGSLCLGTRGGAPLALEAVRAMGKTAHRQCSTHRTGGARSKEALTAPGVCCARACVCPRYLVLTESKIKYFDTLEDHLSESKKVPKLCVCMIFDACSACLPPSVCLFGG